MHGSCQSATVLSLGVRDLAAEERTALPFSGWRSNGNECVPSSRRLSRHAFHRFSPFLGAGFNVKCPENARSLMGDQPDPNPPLCEFKVPALHQPARYGQF